MINGAANGQEVSTAVSSVLAEAQPAFRGADEKERLPTTGVDQPVAQRD